MARTRNDALFDLKILLGIKGGAQDGLLLFALDTVEDRVLRYINHESLPQGLEKTLVLMASSYYKAAGLGSAEASNGPVASVKRGDVSVSYATSGGASGAAQTFNLGDGDSDFFGWRSVLNEYRKLGW